MNTTITNTVTGRHVVINHAGRLPLIGELKQAIASESYESLNIVRSDGALVYISNFGRGEEVCAEVK